jgi:hypothetical protein
MSDRDCNTGRLFHLQAAPFGLVRRLLQHGAAVGALEHTVRASKHLEDLAHGEVCFFVFCFFSNHANKQSSTESPVQPVEYRIITI